MEELEFSVCSKWEKGDYQLFCCNLNSALEPALDQEVFYISSLCSACLLKTLCDNPLTQIYQPSLVTNFSLFACWEKCKLWNHPKEKGVIVACVCVCVCVCVRVCVWQLSICHHCIKHFKCTISFNLGCLKRSGRLLIKLSEKPLYLMLNSPLLTFLKMPLLCLGLLPLHFHVLLLFWIMVQKYWNITRLHKNIT